MEFGKISTRKPQDVIGQKEYGYTTSSQQISYGLECPFVDAYNVYLF